MRYGKAFEEVGKGFINFGVGLLLFLIVQPFVKGELKEEYFVIGLLGAFSSVLIGFILIAVGGNNND